MTNRLAPPPYVVLAKRATAGTNPADGDDLANVNVAPLPDRAMCWAANTLYQLDKSQTGTTILVGTVALQVAPNNGGGLWLPISGEGATALSFTISKPSSSATGAFPDNNTWTAFPNLAWTTEGAASILPFTKNDNGLVLTYAGPDKYFLVQIYGTFLHALAVPGDPDGYADLVVDLNATLLGTTTLIGYNGSGPFGEYISAASRAFVSQQSKILLTSGDTIQPVARRAATGATANDATLSLFRMTVQELEAA